jgi:hypothetical protein
MQGCQKNHQKSNKETEDTILKKLFLWVLMCICVSVYFLKKSQPHCAGKFYLNLEKPIRVPSPHQINLEELIRLPSPPGINVSICLSGLPKNVDF